MSNTDILDISKFKTNKEGDYSLTKPYESKQIVDHIRNFIGECTKVYVNLGDMIITDGTACNGGDTINFSRYFRIVNSVEIDIKNFKLLRTNCKIFKCKNVNLYIQDYTEIFNLLHQDIIYLDPPWGGTGYKNMKKVELKLSNFSLYKIIYFIKTNNLCKFIFIKVPLNAHIDFKYDIINIVYNKVKNPCFKLVCIKL